MRISEIFKLNKSQAELDFVDIELDSDTQLFLDPHFLANRNDQWSQDATRTIRNFFQYLITLLTNNNVEEARKLFSNLNEPNETCLGLSKNHPQGHGVGPKDTNKIFESILHSKAIQSGLVEDLEDCVIFVDNFNKDKLSDMTTNIIRKHLIMYTQAQCKLWNIPLQSQVQSCPFWDRAQNQWVNIYTDMLVIDGKSYLLIPKSVVSYMQDYTPQKFHRHFALNFLKQEHLRLNTALVQRRIKKNGDINTFVTKKSIIETESPGTKEDLNNFVKKYPKIFKNFKDSMRKPSKSLTNEDFSQISLIDIAEHLKKELEKIPMGTEGATAFHDLIIGILEFLFYPELTCPQKEREIHDGRKRIDITFDNAAQNGIFYELSNHIPCQYIFVECKNYSEGNDPKNPEIDQLAGRFSPNKGKVGILVCRKINDIRTLYKRCADTYKDDRGLILPITDQDLITMLNSIKSEKPIRLSDLLKEKRRTIQLD